MKPMFGRLCAAALLVALPGAIKAEEPMGFADQVDAIVADHLKTHPEEVEQIVKDYLAAHPEVIRDAIVDMLKKSRAAHAQASRPQASPDKTVALHSDAAQLSDSPHQVTIGAKTGDVTLVEFFDYNCHFCKRALSDTLALLSAEPNLKIVLREFPVLGPQSVEAARVAIALRMEDVDGTKYLEFHKRMLGRPGLNDQASALSVATELGFDPVKLEQDMASEEVQNTLAESAKLAADLGLAGTPSYIVGDKLIVGAVGLASLEEEIKSERNH
jgi:protein-disulfide isomerase